MVFSIDLRKHAGKIALLLALIVLVTGTFVGVYGMRRFFPMKYSDVIERYAAKYDLPPELVYAIIRAESSFNRYAVSRAGASGLMQIMERTGDWAAEQIGIEDYDFARIFEPEVNIQIGTWYINRLLWQFGGNLETALAAYNAGSGNVSGWLREQGSTDNSLEHIPFGETRNYVARVQTYKEIYRIMLRFRILFS